MAGDGWVADALWRFEPTGAEEPPGRGVTFWTTRWTNEDEAKDFAYALERCFQGRFPGETMSETSPGIRTLSRPDRVYKTEIRGLEVHLRVADATTHAAFEGGAKKKGMESRSRPRK
jgi:hypothetical protein